MRKCSGSRTLWIVKSIFGAVREASCSSVDPKQKTRTHALPTPSPRAPLNPPLNITRNPTTIEVPWLRLHFLPIDIAVPGPRIQTDVSLYRFKPLGRRFITPCSVLYDLFFVLGGLEVPVCSAPFPFAEGGMGGGMERDGKGSSGNVVGWKISVMETF